MGAAYLLPRVVGLARATELLMLGDQVSADEALRIGLVNKVVAPDALMDEARSLAARLAAGPSFALGMTKTLLNQELDIDFASAIEAEAQGQAICMQTPAFRQAYEAFKSRKSRRRARMIALPFFDERHRKLQSRLEAVGARFEPIAANGEAGDVDQAGRDALRECAALGLCRLLVPLEFGGEGLDLRSLCIVREALAASSGLADAVFAVHGLGSYPLTLARTGADVRSAICATPRKGVRSVRSR